MRSVSSATGHDILKPAVPELASPHKQADVKQVIPCYEGRPEGCCRNWWLLLRDRSPFLLRVPVTDYGKHSHSPPA